MNKTAAALLAATVIVGGGAAHATVVKPEPAPMAGVPFHPEDTTLPPFMPANCQTVVRIVHAEEHRLVGRQRAPQVRELLIYRLRCENGRGRALLVRGPWLAAFVAPAPEPEPTPDPTPAPEPVQP